MDYLNGTPLDRVFLAPNFHFMNFPIVLRVRSDFDRENTSICELYDISGSGTFGSEQFSMGLKDFLQLPLVRLGVDDHSKESVQVLSLD